jgi:hypothetical protein
MHGTPVKLKNMMLLLHIGTGCNSPERRVSIYFICCFFFGIHQQLQLLTKAKYGMTITARYSIQLGISPFSVPTASELATPSCESLRFLFQLQDV